MKIKKFDELVEKHFSPVLEEYGFLAEKSKQICFYRKLPENIYHVISPVLNSDGTSFRIWVFATSSIIEPDFESKHIDDVGIPSGGNSTLHTKLGVGVSAHKYRCKYEEGFIKNFNKDVVPSLEKFAIPYLNSITNLTELLPYINVNFYLGATLWHLDSKEEAVKILNTERNRLLEIATDSETINSRIIYIDDKLARA